MGEAKRSAAAFAYIRDQRWRDALIRAEAALAEVPQSVRQAWVSAFDTALAAADAEQVSPFHMAVLMATSMGGLCLVTLDGNPMNNAEVDAFVQDCHAALHMGVARARIAAGWTPGGRH